MRREYSQGVRRFEDCTVSLMRFIADTGRDGSSYSTWIRSPDGPERLARFLEEYHWYYDKWVKPVTAWKGQAGSLPVRYESLLGDYGQADQHETLRSICIHLGVDVNSVDLHGVLDAVLNKSTMTWSGQRSEIEKYWSREVEDLFIRFGGFDLNRRLGYEPSSPRIAFLPSWKRWSVSLR